MKIYCRICGHECAGTYIKDENGYPICRSCMEEQEEINHLQEFVPPDVIIFKSTLWKTAGTMVFKVPPAVLWRLRHGVDYVMTAETLSNYEKRINESASEGSEEGDELYE